MPVGVAPVQSVGEKIDEVGVGVVVGVGGYGLLTAIRPFWLLRVMAASISVEVIGDDGVFVFGDGFPQMVRICLHGRS